MAKSNFKKSVMTLYQRHHCYYVSTSPKNSILSSSQSKFLATPLITHLPSILVVFLFFQNILTVMFTKTLIIGIVRMPKKALNFIVNSSILLFFLYT